MCQLNQRCLRFMLENKTGHQKLRLFVQYIVFGLYGVLLCRDLNYVQFLQKGRSQLKPSPCVILFTPQAGSCSVSQCHIYFYRTQIIIITRIQRIQIRRDFPLTTRIQRL